MDASLPLSPHARGVRLAVRITPRAARNAIEGVAIDAAGRPELRIRLTAAPVDGSANVALIELLAGALGLRKRDIEILSGAAARSKTLLLKGDGEAIAVRIAELRHDGRAPGVALR